MILCAYQFKDQDTNQEDSVFDQWLRWGGIESDYQTLTQVHVDWIKQLPTMVLLDDALLVHADAMLYVNHGRTIEEVNASFQALMQSDDLTKWQQVLSAFSEHMAFSALEITGKQRAEKILSLYDGKQIIHGHTPIPYARQIEADTVTDAWVYAGNRCVNVDGGMYMGSPGFVYEL